MPLSSVSLPVFAILAALVEEYAGLHFAPTDRETFLDRVSGRAEEAGFDSLLDYYYFLRYDQEGRAELDQLVDSLVVNETYFFRELEPLKLIVSEFVLPLVKSGKTPRIWSAACATGEEPLTLAMLLAEADILRRTEIVASDISVRALSRARAGQYGRRSLRDATNHALSSRYLRQGEGGTLSVDPALPKAIDWRRLNLCDRQSALSVGPCDVVLCRNALIYFKDETLVRVLDNLALALAPKGALFVGISESLLRFGTSWACEEKNQVFFYRKEP